MQSREDSANVLDVAVTCSNAVGDVRVKIRGCARTRGTPTIGPSSKATFKELGQDVTVDRHTAEAGLRLRDRTRLRVPAKLG